MAIEALKVVCGIVVHGSRILATRRDPRRAFPLHWEFPGGKVEENESLEEALHRELEEELSLKVRILRALKPVIYSAEGHHIQLIPFLCKPAQAHGVVPHDHVEVRWIEPAEAAHLTWAPADVPLVEKLQKRHSLVED